MKYYLIAGERSGDLHGSNLIKALKKEDQEAAFRAWGGDYMQSAGAKIVIHYDKMAIMGFSDAVKNIPRFKRYIDLCSSDIDDFKPDVVILIDFAGFNLRVARLAKSKSLKVFYYISPKLWAWSQKRVVKVRKYVDRMYAILPFEVDFYKNHEIEVDYVGNPVVDAVNLFEPDPDFCKNHNLHPSKKIIALLPGSRTSEIKYNLPLLARFADQYPDMQFAVSAVSNVPLDKYLSIIGEKPVTLVMEDTYNLLFKADYAIVCSGTATLETSLFDVPQIVVYKTSAINYLLGRLVIKVKYISLVNLILDEGLVKELIQNDLSDESLGKTFDQLVYDTSVKENMLRGYRRLRAILGTENASGKLQG